MRHLFDTSSVCKLSSLSGRDWQTFRRAFRRAGFTSGWIPRVLGAEVLGSNLHRKALTLAGLHDLQLAVGRMHKLAQGRILPDDIELAQRSFYSLAGIAYKSFHLEEEHITEFDYQPGACKKPYRMIALRKRKRHIPGLGVVLAATAAVEAGPIQRFRTAKAFARYTGLTPGERSTGGRTIHVGISREGSPHLRWALTQAAMACLKGRQGNALAVGTWIRAKERRVGGKAKARVAGARKLSETIWRLFHYGELFDASRPFGGRRSEASA